MYRSREGNSKVAESSECAARVIMPKQKGYSEDLRWRIVWMYLYREMTYKQVSETMLVSEKSVQRHVHLFNVNGNGMYQRNSKEMDQAGNYHYDGVGRL